MGERSGSVVGGISPHLLLMLLTGLVLVVHGYHPYAEDGGLYVAGIKKVLDPSLYGGHADFVTAHLRFSLFAPLVAGLVRGSGVPLRWMLLVLYAASAWLTLFAAWRLSAQITASAPGRAGAVTLVACWFTLPVAGTSLMLMDPYVTARTLSTPLTLLALGSALEAVRAGASGAGRGAGFGAGLGPGLRCCGALVGAGLLHPLMAGYGLLAVLLLTLLGSRRRWVRLGGPWLVGGLALGGAALLQGWATPESTEYVRVAMTRTYWFPSEWMWYERLGAVAPLGVIALLGFGRGGGQLLAATAEALGAISLLLASVYAREGLDVHAVARLQPLRCLQTVYFVMTLLLGVWLGERWLGERWLRWCGLVAISGGAMLVSARQTYPASAHLELPWRVPSNEWEQGFVWARDHTATDAVFALDARYITRGKDEDAQVFRAIAERDALPDYSKDGGEASISPRLTAAWIRGQSAQNDLDRESDGEREAALRGLGVSWVILEAGSATGWQCPYANRTIKVCQVRE